jgi:hypothetical protein
MKGFSPIFTERLLTTETITASGTKTTRKIDLAQRALNGVFSVQYLITGTGTCSITYSLSNEADSGNMITPSTAINIGTSLTATTGPGSNGKDILPFEPELGRWLSLTVTETGGAQSVIVTLDIAIH